MHYYSLDEIHEGMTVSINKLSDIEGIKIILSNTKGTKDELGFYDMEGTIEYIDGVSDKKNEYNKYDNMFIFYISPSDIIMNLLIEET